MRRPLQEEVPLLSVCRGQQSPQGAVIHGSGSSQNRLEQHHRNSSGANLAKLMLIMPQERFAKLMLIMPEEQWSSKQSFFWAIVMEMLTRNFFPFVLKKGTILERAAF